MSNDQPRVERPTRTPAERDAAHHAGLDGDTIDHGTDGPFDYWESDHTALVHVLWNAKHNGLTLQNDADQIASLINQSRWLAAQNAAAVDKAEKAWHDSQDQAPAEVPGSAS